VSDEDTGGEQAGAVGSPVDTAADDAAVPAVPNQSSDVADDNRATPDASDVQLNLATISDPIATARRRHGAAGAMLAAGMFGVDIALGRKPREDVPVVVAANSEPVDIDTEGIEIAVDDNISVVSPALPRSEPQRRPRRSRRSRR
jgi:hypothetical protein